MQSQPLTFQSKSTAAYSPAADDKIVLCTLNARYIHASLGLRYLLANMGVLQKQTSLLEFTINQRATDIAEQLLACNPKIIEIVLTVHNGKLTTILDT